VSHATVLTWVKRAAGQRLDRVEWGDRPSGPHRPWNRTSDKVEHQVLKRRERLKGDRLGYCGAKEIERSFRTGTGPKLAVRTVGRILERHGALDGRHRVRRPPPPRGWYLPEVACGKMELDSFDVIEGLRIEGGPRVEVLTGVSLHGGLVEAWPEKSISAKVVVERLLEHWRRRGLPGYAQFDNDTCFQGAHQFPDSYGRVTRLCLALGITPLFTPPREVGFQAMVERLNGLWQDKVWRRFHHRSLVALPKRSRAYTAAHHLRTQARRESGPSRRPMVPGFRLDLGQALRGKVIFLRRTNEDGFVEVLGHTQLVAPDWAGRLVRCTVDLDAGALQFHSLRRRAPDEQELLREVAYQPPLKAFQGS
jgi:hypothetical protein